MRRRTNSCCIVVVIFKIEMLRWPSEMHVWTKHFNRQYSWQVENTKRGSFEQVSSLFLQLPIGLDDDRCLQTGGGEKRQIGSTGICSTKPISFHRPPKFENSCLWPLNHNQKELPSLACSGADLGFSWEMKKWEQQVYQTGTVFY